VAWSQNLTADQAAETGAELFTMEGPRSRSDVMSLHLRLNERTRGSWLSRTSR
jgi:phosphoglycerate dehydrogenase-like enzyme